MSADFYLRWVEERTRLGFDQPKLAKLMEVSPETVRLWEKGSRTVNAQNLARAHALGFDIIYVLSGQRNTKVSSPSSPVSIGSVSGIGVAQSGANVHLIQTQRHVTNTRAIVEPGESHISEVEARILTDLVDKIVTLENLLKKTPKTHKSVWSGLNAHCRVTRYRLIAREDFPRARKYLDQWIGRLNSSKSAPEKDGNNWRNGRYSFIKSNSKTPEEVEAVSRYIQTKFGASSLKDLSTEELERTYRYVASRKNKRKS